MPAEVTVTHISFNNVTHAENRDYENSLRILAGYNSIAVSLIRYELCSQQVFR